MTKLFSNGQVQIHGDSKIKKGNRIILDQSYRVPRAVQHKALNVINRIPGDQRVEKSWKSVDREGLFKIHTNPIPGMDF